jgi:hypothetical protein
MDLQWVGRLTRSRILWYLIIAAVAVAGVVFRLVGLGRSVWLDEAWVANSVTAGSLAGMFRYDAWLQTSPPLFLLLMRMTVGSLGLTPSTLRLIPLLFGLIAILCMFVLTQRILSPRFALPAWPLFVLSPVAILYSKTIKQYSLELAAVTAVLLTCILYLELPTTRRFWLLVTTVAGGLLIAYPVAFLLPGIILVVGFAQNQPETSVTAPGTAKWGGLVRSLILTLVSGGILIGIYFLLVLPNTSPYLRTFFANDSGSLSFFRAAFYDGYNLFSFFPFPASVLERKKLVGGFFGLLLLAGFLLACLQFRKGTRKWLEAQVLFAVPIFLLIIGWTLDLYPMRARTGLFLLPALILLFFSDLELIVDFSLHRLRREWLELPLDIALLCAALLLFGVGVRKQPLSTLKVPDEDVASAVSYLRSSIQRGDVLWVHASCSEAFKLYAKMTAWSDAPARFGNTGWPCCPRGIPVVEGSSREEDVRSDINSGVPAGFSGRVWLLYTGRNSHWRFVGADEPKTVEAVFRERGCLQQPVPAFHNIGVSSFDCRAAQVAVPR